MPDYYRGKTRPSGGNIFGFIKEVSNWTSLKQDWEKKICPYARRQGGKVFGAIGTCWGSYMVMKLSAYDEVVAGVSMHPSHPGIMKALGEDEEMGYKDLMNTSRQLMMPAGNFLDYKTVFVKYSLLLNALNLIYHVKFIQGLENKISTPCVIYVGSDPMSVKPGGLASEVLGDGVEFQVFPEMRHGWTTRGDLNDVKIAEAAKSAMERATQFFNANMN